MTSIKKLVGIALTVFTGAVAGWSQAATPPAEVLNYPQMVVYNGKILTMDDTTFASNVGTIVQAMAVRDGRVIKVGNNADVRALAGPQTRQIDLKGRMVVPGFSMTHEHPVDWMWTEPLAFRHVFPNDNEIVSRWMPNKSAKEQLALFEPTMKEALSKAKPGQWIRIIPNWGPDYEWAEQFSGRGACCRVFDDSIKKEYLDTLAPNNPVCLSDGFTSGCQANTKGVEEYRSVHADVSERAVSSGGLGRLTPSDVILKNKVPLLAELLKSEMELWARYGTTAYGSAPYAYSNLQALNILDQRNDMPARYAWTWHSAVAPKGWDLDTLRHLSGMLGQGSDYLWFIGAFGAAGGCWSIPERADFTMAMKEARGQSYQPGGCGNAPGTESWDRNVAIAQSGLRIATMHSDGDKGIDYVLDAIEEGSKRAGLTIEEIRAKRHTFDHSAGAPRPDQIPRLKNLGMMTSMLNTVLWENHRGASMTARQYGLEYTSWVVPRKSVTSAGIMNTFEIDRPLPHKLFFFVTKGMNRYNDKDKREYGPGEKTDRVTQLKALTTWAGYYVLREKQIGMLGQGAYADFLVLDRDFLTIPEADIPKIQVLMTVVGGRPIHLGATLAREIGMQPVGPSTWTEPIPEGWEPKPY
ncbi:MAG: amidohydrolase family protein [Acidobacteria bacterium]|nr:amidohydrolase family protein [Acidobacteriota bacterium]